MSLVATMPYRTNTSGVRPESEAMWTVQGEYRAEPHTESAGSTKLAINSGNPYPFLQFGGTTDNIGIQFIASANQPAGYSWVFKWVNLISDQ